MAPKANARIRRTTIRTTLLVAFISVGVLSAGALAALAFAKVREALRTEIDRGLMVQAKGLSAEIDKMMFERLQNAATWSRLDVMQDLQVQDVDKRLSQFLTDLQTGYGDVYLKLYAADPSGRVISSSDAAQVGQTIASSKPYARTTISRTSVDIRIDRHGRMTFAVPIGGAYRKGALGELDLELARNRIEELLGQTAGRDSRLAAVVDAHGRVIAASASLRSPEADATLVAWAAARTQSPFIRGGGSVSVSDVIVGSSASKGFSGFDGLGWTTMVVQPIDAAFEPIRRMAIHFGALLVLILVLTALLALAVSHRIAAPIAALTAFVRAHKGRSAAVAAPASRRGEVGELTSAFVSMVEDMARSQERLVHASKLAAVGEMSAVIAHEVRTPLGILKSSAQMLRRERAISADGHELLGFIESETERLNRLVSAMLEAVRSRDPVLAPMNAAALISDCIAMLGGQAAARSVSLAQQLDDPEALISGDREQLTQVLLNLLVNAIQIVPEGGRILVTLRRAPEQVILEVEDDGPGVRVEDRQRIFDAFFFRREGGIGLGLAIVRDIACAHGGDIEVGESRWGGAVFRVILPGREGKE